MSPEAAVTGGINVGWDGPEPRKAGGNAREKLGSARSEATVCLLE